MRVEYGTAMRQHVDVTTPSSGGPFATVVLIHGGFWSNAYRSDLMDDLAEDLLQHGFATVNVEYRSLGDEGGGWPGTFEDVAAALDAVPGAVGAGFHPQRLVAVGHSAGGHLAAWAASRPSLPAGAPGANPTTLPTSVVSLAGVLDLAACAHDGLGGGACTALLDGTPREVPDRYQIASPIERLPIGVSITCVHGRDDRHVPIEQSRRFVSAATAAGDRAELLEVDGDHLALIDPASMAWAAARNAITAATH